MEKLIYIGGLGSCTVHNQKGFLVDILGYYLEENGYSFTDNYEKADYIVLTDTCFGYQGNIKKNIEYFSKIKEHAQKNEGVKVILSGCAVRGLQDKYTNLYKVPYDDELNLSYFQVIPREKLISYFLKEFFPDKTRVEFTGDMIPFSSITGFDVSASIVDGCSNRCSFCKTNFLDFSLKSEPLEKVNDLIYIVDGLDKVRYLSLFSSNLSLYGKDLYHEQMIHEVINCFSRIVHIKYMDVGALIDFYPELVEEIIDNKKVKSIHVSLETGSERLHKMMSRPIALGKLKEYLTEIRSKRPDILIVSEVIAGFPTETEKDIQDTLDLIRDLKIYNKDIHGYINSSAVPSSRYPQYSREHILESTNRMKELLASHNEQVLIDFENQGAVVLMKEDDSYLTMLPDRVYGYVSMDDFDRDYEPGDIVTEDVHGNKIRQKIYSSS